VNWSSGIRKDSPEIAALQVPSWHCPSDPNVAKIWDPQTPEQKAENSTPSGLTSYLAVNGTDQFAFNGIVFVNSKVKIKDIKDGVSNTLLVGERPASPDQLWGFWWSRGAPPLLWGAADFHLGVNEMKMTFQWAGNVSTQRYSYGPGDWNGYQNLDLAGVSNDSVWHFWSNHPGGANFVFADGHASKTSYGIGQDIINALATRAGKEVVNGDW
jgi:prepilin-type processing-associated H-X9-DG protein